MKERQRIIALLICCLTILSSLLPAYGQSESSTFSDVKTGDWFADVVGEASRRSIISGYTDGSFRPNKQVSYGEFLAMALALEYISQEENPVHWAGNYYIHAISMGYFEYSDFSMDDLNKTIPRKDMALIMAGLIEERELEISEKNAVFSDVSEDDPRAEAIRICVDAGVLSGYPDGSFRPEGSLKRSEAAAAIMNYIHLIDESLEYGAEVIGISRNFINYISEDGEQVDLYIGEEFYYSEEPDPYEGMYPIDLVREDHQQLLDEIMATAKISGTPGHYTFSYTQPQIPDLYHFGVSISVYKSGGPGTDNLIYSNVSDSGWLADISNYDPSAHTVAWELGKDFDNPKELAIVLNFKIFDNLDEAGNMGEGAIYKFFVDYDGSWKRMVYVCRLAGGCYRDYEISEEMSDEPFFL